MSTTDKSDNRTWEDIVRQVFGKAAKDPEYAKRKLTPDWYISFIKGKVLPEEFAKIKTRERRTVIERLSYWSNRFKVDYTVADKRALGDLCKDAFFHQDGGAERKQFAFFENISEPEGDFKVLVYPPKFVPVMDAIIIKYLQEYKGLVLPEKVNQES